MKSEDFTIEVQIESSDTVNAALLKVYEILIDDGSLKVEGGENM